MILASCAILICYLIGVLIHQKEIPISLSSTYYTFNKKPWFTFALLCITALIMIPTLEISDDQNRWLIFLACAGCFLCAIAPNFKEELEGKVHYTGAIMAGIFSQVWCYLYNPFTLILWILVAGGLCVLYLYEKYIDKKPTAMFWAEMVCFINIYYTYYFLN